MSRDTISVADIKQMLIDRLPDVAYRYAPAAQGSYTAFGKYFTLNPGRHDRRVGSFYVNVSGASAGNWCDHAVPAAPGVGFGDLIDLIALSCSCSNADAIKEARAYLGLSVLDPSTKRRMEEQAKSAAQRRDEEKRREGERQARKSRAAQAIWLSAQERIAGTPVDHYLRGRCIDLSEVGRQPSAVRYHPACHYYWQDPETGEVIERDMPAMVTMIQDKRGATIALHRTYLEQRDGRWQKAVLPCGKAKKVLGPYRGGWINIWRGTGPRGGRPASISASEGPLHVYVTEGIEDALSGVILLPDVRWIAAVSLSNMGSLDLPASVTEITLAADRDENATARAQLERVIATHQQAGRIVRLWQNYGAGKDLNDALIAVRKGGANG